MLEWHCHYDSQTEILKTYTPCICFHGFLWTAPDIGIQLSNHLKSKKGELYIWR